MSKVYQQTLAWYPVQGSGLVVNVCSVSSYVALPLSAAYCASKAALLAATNVARMELAPLGVRVMGARARKLLPLHAHKRLDACLTSSFCCTCIPRV
jgi:NADP-dependent 3-hydroxy acid dehydrogenase YdfG